MNLKKLRFNEISDTEERLDFKEKRTKRFFGLNQKRLKNERR
jgi:hypothetical protein